MYIISKTIKGQEFLYSNKYSILCKNEKQAKELANFMNKNDDKTIGQFKLKENELWHVYEIDMYDTPARYKLKSTRNKISIVENY